MIQMLGLKYEGMMTGLVARSSKQH